MGAITINVNVSVEDVNNLKKLCLESWYMQLSKWKIFSKYYGWFNDYVWWNYRVIWQSCTAKYILMKKKQKKTVCKTKHFYFLLAFLLITMTLLMSVSIYCYLLKYRAKQKHLLRDKNNELKQILFKCCLIT